MYLRVKQEFGRSRIATLHFGILSSYVFRTFHDGIILFFSWLKISKSPIMDGDNMVLERMYL